MRPQTIDGYTHCSRVVLAFLGKFGIFGKCQVFKLPKKSQYLAQNNCELLFSWKYFCKTIFPPSSNGSNLPRHDSLTCSTDSTPYATIQPDVTRTPLLFTPLLPFMIKIYVIVFFYNCSTVRFGLFSSIFTKAFHMTAKI